MDDLTIKILIRLYNNIPPSAVQLGLSSQELVEKLNEMKKEELIDFDLIKDHLIFKGEPENTRLTEKGREIAEENKHIWI